MADWPSFFSGLSGILLGAAIIATVIRGWRDDLATLKHEVQKEQAARLTRLEHNMDALKVEANPPLVTSQLQGIANQLDKIDGKVDRLDQLSGRLEERLKANESDTQRAHNKIADLRKSMGAVGV